MCHSSFFASDNDMREKHLVIVDYRPEWAEQFEAEKARIVDTVGNYIEAVEHIGSTSVVGLAAKPVIDITIGVKSLIIADQYCIEPIVGLGYEYVPQFEDMMPTRRYFRRSNADGVRSHKTIYGRLMILNTSVIWSSGIIYAHILMRRQRMNC